MDGFVYLNGIIVAANEARISPFDRGFLYGDGLFETMRCYGGQIHLFGRHLRRLRESAAVIALSIPTDDQLVNAVRLTIEANGLTDAVIRLTVSRGVDESLSGSTIMVHHRPVSEDVGEDGFNPGEAVITVDAMRGKAEFGVALKSLSFLTSAQAWTQLATAQVREGIMMTPEGYVAEGTVSSLFCLRDGVLLTPPLSLGILHGITRQRVLELARDVGLQVAQESFYLDLMLSAHECFYTNSVREVIPIRSIDGHVIGTGMCGAVTDGLRRAYRSEVPNEDLGFTS